LSSAAPEVVIIGAGFGGLYAARALRDAPVHVTVIDKRNHHLFQPLLYQVATAALNPADIAAPVRSILRKQRNAEVILGEVKGIDVPNRRVELNDGAVSFDYCIVATGATHSYFGNDHWSELAPGLKTIEDALEIRRRIFLAFEAAERESDPAKRTSWMTFVVVGGGPTGVELAGSLAEIARHTLSRDFRRIRPSEARVILLEGLEHVLPTYPEKLSAKARRQLEAIGVEVQTSRRVTGIDAEGVSLGEERIPARTVLWAAGVRASELGASLGAPLDRAGRVLVESDLTIPGSDRLFVIGDLAAVADGEGWVPGVAQAAMQAGEYAARRIVDHMNGRPTPPFRYRNKGNMATIGRAAAVADLSWFHLSGLPAWLAWTFVHILFLIGFRNRLLVMIQWAWSYLTYNRGARLITGSPEKLLPGDHD
jgi:NADH:ubiquinone reductase (H+-translocating)